MAAYRNDLDALANRHATLTSELEAKEREVAQVARVLEEAKERLRLPVLEDIRVATPCRADWNQMAGDERVRACGECKKDVFNLSGMTRQEAETLIRDKNGDLCVRYYRRHDGTILLKDCSVGVSQKRKRRVIAAGVAVLLGGGAMLAYKLTHPHPRDPELIMGATGWVPESVEAIEGGLSAPPAAQVPQTDKPVIVDRTVEIK